MSQPLYWLALALQSAPQAPEQHMTAFEVFSVVQALLMALAAVLVAVAARSFRAGQWVRGEVEGAQQLAARIGELTVLLKEQDERHMKEMRELNERFMRELRDLDAEVANRFESGNREMSKLSGAVNSMPDRFRDIFVSRELFAEVRQTWTSALEHNRKSVAQLWQAVRNIRGQDGGLRLGGDGD